MQIPNLLEFIENRSEQESSNHKFCNLFPNISTQKLMFRCVDVECDRDSWLFGIIWAKCYLAIKLSYWIWNPNEPLSGNECVKGFVDHEKGVWIYRSFVLILLKDEWTPKKFNKTWKAQFHWVFVARQYCRMDFKLQLII